MWSIQSGEGLEKLQRGPGPKRGCLRKGNGFQNLLRRRQPRAQLTILMCRRLLTPSSGLTDLSSLACIHHSAPEADTPHDDRRQRERHSREESPGAQTAGPAPSITAHHPTGIQNGNGQQQRGLRAITLRGRTRYTRSRANSSHR